MEVLGLLIMGFSGVHTADLQKINYLLSFLATVKNGFLSSASQHH